MKLFVIKYNKKELVQIVGIKGSVFTDVRPGELVLGKTYEEWRAITGRNAGGCNNEFDIRHVEV